MYACLFNNFCSVTSVFECVNAFLRRRSSCVLSVYCRLRPLSGYAMASLRQRSAALVAGGSRRFCYQIDGVAEHLGGARFQIHGGNTHCSVFFSVLEQSHLLPMNGRSRRRSPPPPPPELQSAQRDRSTWPFTNYSVLLLPMNLTHFTNSAILIKSAPKAILDLMHCYDRDMIAISVCMLTNECSPTRTLINIHWYFPRLRALLCQILKPITVSALN